MDGKTSILHSDEHDFVQKEEAFRVYNVDDFDHMYTRLHEHGFLEIFMLLSGSVTYVFENGAYELRDFDIVLAPPHTLHQLVVTRKNVRFKRMVLWISFPYLKHLSSKTTDLYEGLRAFTSSGEYILRNPEFTFQIKPYLEKVIRLQEEKPYGGDLLIENTLRELLIEMNRFIQERGEEHIESELDPAIQSLTRFIDEHLSEELTLETIAEQLHFSPSYISHLFAEKTGTTVHKYITKKRLTEARRYLERGMSNKDLIGLVGYKDESHFTQAFKKEYGYTPRQYKAHMRSGKGS